MVKTIGYVMSPLQGSLRRHSYWLIAAFAVLLAIVGCTSDEAATDGDGRTPLRLAAAVNVQSRADFGLDEKINAGEQVNVWVDDATDNSALYTNDVLTVADDATLTGGTPMYFPLSGNALNVYALHANATLSGTDFPTEAFTHTVETDQTETANYAKSDLLYAEKTEVVRTTNNVDLTFNHLLSKVEVVLKEGDGDEGFLDKISSVELQGLKTSANVTLTKGETPTVEVADGEATTIAISTTATQSDAKTNTLNEAVIVPQTVAANTDFIKVTLEGGAEYIYTLPAETTFETAKRYTYTLTLNQTAIDVTVSIGSWDSGDAFSGQATMPIISLNIDDYTTAELTDGLITSFVQNGEIKVTGTYDESKLKTITSKTSVTTIDITELKEMKEVPYSMCNNKKYLQTIKLPKTVTKIGSSAFSECNALLSITGLDNVTNIETGAFNGCTSLDTIYLPNVKSIGTTAFQYCSKLKTINLPSATSIGFGAIQYCTALETINLPNVTTIETAAFNSCTALKTVILPKVTSVSTSIFSSCKKITTMDLSSVKTVSNYLFSGYTNLKSINLSSATSIGYNTFYNCTSLDSISLPKVTSIGKNAFSGSNIKYISLISDKLSSVNSNSFTGVSDCELHLNENQSGNIVDGVWTIGGISITLSDYFSAVYCGNTLVYETPKTE